MLSLNNVCFAHRKVTIFWSVLGDEPVNFLLADVAAVGLDISFRPLVINAFSEE